MNNPIKRLKWPVLLLLVLGMACKKNDNPLDNMRTPLPKDVKGTLYWTFGRSAQHVNFETGKYVDHMMYMGTGTTSDFESFDISWDNQNILLTTKRGQIDRFNERRFVFRKNTDGIALSDLSDGTNLFDHIYRWRDIKETWAYISPNGKYLALEAFSPSWLPTTILDAQTGSYVSSWTVEGIGYSYHGKPVWTADNALYFRIGNNVLACSPSDGYQSAPFVLTLPEGSSNFTINPQGTKGVYRNDKHLWMCNMDGSDHRQITTSVTSNVLAHTGENIPTFSPDGKYIAFTAATRRGLPWLYVNDADGSWHVWGTNSRIGYIVIIPADGKLYDMDDINSGAVWLTEPGSEQGLTSSHDHSLIWR